jgi:hypothetical protein
VTVRILSGILLAGQASGRATIRFSPHDVEGDARGLCQVEIGPDAEFTSPPARIVSLREVCDQGKGSRIDEHVHTETLLEVSWEGAKELAYLVIGEVAD